VGFAEFVVLQQLGEEPEEKRATTDEERRQRTARRDARHDAERRELEAATKGVLGMMRFGNFESPVLLEALGDLLLSGDTRNDSKRLAGRAYLKASYGVKDARTKRRFREMADQTISGHMQMEVAQLERTFKRELAEAANWYKRVEADELAWIEQGVDVDAAFAEKYYSAPTVGGPVAAVMTSQRASIVMWVLTLGVVAVVAVAAIAGLGLAIIIFRRKPSLPAKPA
jgi:hypothetical protein